MVSRRLTPVCALALGLLLALGGVAAAQSSATVRAVQSYLDTQGYNAGTPDGIMGAHTESAIRAFEKDRGRTPTGRLSDWLVNLATKAEASSGQAGTATTSSGSATGGTSSSSAASASSTTGLSTAATASEASVSALNGDPTALSGTGELAVTKRDDGSLLITDGLPWRAGVSVTPRTIKISSTALDLFKTTSDSKVPVPIDNDVVDVPGTTFVPVFLAADRQAAEKGSLADAVGVTWKFLKGGVSLDIGGGHVLSADKPGATLSFSKQGVIATGFTLTSQ